MAGLVVSDRKFNWALIVVILLASTPTWLTLAQRYAPVVLLMTAEAFVPGPGTITTRVTGYKIRSCPLVEGSLFGYSLEAHFFEEVPIEWVDDPTPYSAKDAQWFERQSFNLWRWHVDPTVDQTVKATLEHDCGNGRIITTTIGPFTHKVTL